jgi:hypothetical protein
MRISRELAAVSVLVGGALFARAARAAAPSGTPLKIDHPSICGSALAPMESAFAEAGLSTEYGGPHATGGTHMALLGFEDGSYLELIAPQGSRSSVRDSPWGKAMAGDAGPCAWAVGTSNIRRDVDRLVSLRVTTSGPDPGSRARPDGTVIRWKTATLGKGIRGATLPFLIEDVTPRELRVRPSPSAAAGGLTGIRFIVVGVKRLEPAIAEFRRAWGWGAPEIGIDRALGARLAFFPGEPAVLAEPLSKKGSPVAYRLQRLGAGPIAIVLGTRDFDGARKRFDLQSPRVWFGKSIAWFPSNHLRGARIGVIAP